MNPAPARRAAPDAATDTDVLERLLVERHSCRAFKPEPLPRATIERILNLAQRTASWCNSQPWQVVITSGEGTERFRKAMYEHAAGGAEGRSDFERPREYRGVYLARRRESGFQLYNTLGIPRGDKEGYERQSMENFRFFGAPHVAIVHSDEALGTYGGVDSGGYVGNFMLAAQSMGVGTIAQAALARYSDFLHEYFKIPADRLVVCGISFGYPDREHLVNSYRTSRASLDETVTWVE